MTNKKLSKIIKITGIIILTYLIIDVLYNLYNLINNIVNSSDSFLSESLKAHIYFALGLKVLILISLIFLIIRGIKRTKWINLIITIPLLIILPKFIYYLPTFTHSAFVTAQQNSDKVLYSDILEKQEINIDSSNITTKRIYQFYCKNGQPKKEGVLINHLEFDSRGNTIKDNNKQFFYDSLSRLTMEIELNDINEAKDTTLYFYDSENYLVEDRYKASRYTRNTKYIYDSNKNKIGQISYKNGSIDYESRYFYDTEDRLIKSTSKNHEENYILKDTYKYIDNRVINYNYTREGKLYYEVHTTYDSFGKEIEQSVIHNNPEMQFDHYSVYNNNGNIIKKESKTDGKTSRFELWEYDNQNNLVSFTDYNGKIKYYYSLNMRTKEEFYNKETGNLEWIKLYLYN
jgi:YD repeat-containing protein